MPNVIGPLLPAQVDQFWSHLSAGFQRSNLRSGGDLTLGELWMVCRSGNAFLFVAHEGDTILGASIWKPQQWQTGAKLRCLGLYGRQMKTWIYDMQELVERVAKDCGANGLVSDGRPGWRAIFPHAKVLRLVYEEPI